MYKIALAESQISSRYEDKKREAQAMAKLLKFLILPFRRSHEDQCHDENIKQNSV
jgi:hypothetical protein